MCLCFIVYLLSLPYENVVQNNGSFLIIALFKAYSQRHMQNVFKSEQVLNTAGNNRLELEKDFECYSGHTPRFAAATFLEGMDFGKPASSSAIEITGRGDGNAIECGNLYERFYFKGSWQSRGQKNGAGMTVTSGNVPEIALRLMHDYTNGNERISTYENGW